MLGLRTEENNEFLNFFKLVQNEAQKQNAVFFMECGCGDVLSEENIECEDCQGWLIPVEKAEEFNKLFLAENVDEKWDEFEAWADWKKTSNGIQVTVEILK